MKNKNIKELLTAYLDNEIKSQEELNNIKSEIEKDPSLEFDLKAESLTKKLINKKAFKNATPDKLKKDIAKKLSGRGVIPAKKPSFTSKIYSQRFITYSTAGIVLLALLLL